MIMNLTWTHPVWNFKFGVSLSEWIDWKSYWKSRSLSVMQEIDLVAAKYVVYWQKLDYSQSGKYKGFNVEILTMTKESFFNTEI